MDFDLKKGALHRQLGRGKNYKFTKSELTSLNKFKVGEYFGYNGKDRKMTPLLKKRITFALNFGYRKESPRGGMKGKTYQEMIDEMEKNRGDTEIFHIKRDEIMCRFFIDMDQGKFKTKKEINRITDLIYEHCVNIDKYLWFS